MLYDANQTACAVDGHPVVEVAEPRLNETFKPPLFREGSAEPKPFLGFIGLPPRQKKPRRCSCGGHLVVTSWNQWYSQGFFRNKADGYDLNYECEKCRRKITIPSNLRLFYVILGCVISLGMAVALVWWMAIQRKFAVGAIIGAAIVGSIGILSSVSVYSTVNTRCRFPVVEADTSRKVIKCVKCNQRLRAPTDRKRTTLRCPKCKSEFEYVAS